MIKKKKSLDIRITQSKHKQYDRKEANGEQ